MLHVAGVLTPEECAEVRRLIDGGQWVSGHATAGKDAAEVKHNRQVAAEDPAGKAAGTIILAALARSKTFAAATLPAKIAPPAFNRHGIGENYGDHIDNAIRPLGSGRMRADLSATLFLSAPDSYAGGALVIDTAAGTQRVKLPAGDMILYPADTIHRVEPVTAGEREVSFFWIQSLIRDGKQRDVLFRLDRDIQALSTAAAPRPTLVSLAALYHNLLRLWADP